VEPSTVETSAAQPIVVEPSTVETSAAQAIAVQPIAVQPSAVEANAVDASAAQENAVEKMVEELPGRGNAAVLVDEVAERKAAPERKKRFLSEDIIKWQTERRAELESEEMPEWAKQ
jgi:hypothetical protein